jgi:UvrD-like helicase C-terminal domain
MVKRLTPNPAANPATGRYTCLPVLRAAARRCETGQTATNTNRCLSRVYFRRSNYNKGKAGIFNGTIGVVTSLSLQEQTLTVLTDEDEQIDYDFAELDELAHAYAVTIHRSQGSEYPAVVIPLTTSSWMMLQRYLLYTGVTGPSNSSSSSDPAARSPKPSAPTEPAAATPHSPISSITWNSCRLHVNDSNRQYWPHVYTTG